MIDYERVKSDSVSAELYTQRKPRKHRSEMQMVSEAFQMLPGSQVKTVLDAPCGVGRLSLWLAQKGYQVTAVDLGEAATQLTKNSLADYDLVADVECQDVFNMSFDDDAFDAVVCFRLLHHFKEAEDQQALISELSRVSSRFIVISYFSSYSVTSLKRKMRKLLAGTPVKQNSLSLTDLKKFFDKDDYKLIGTVKRSGFLHSLQLAVFAREA